MEWYGLMVDLSGRRCVIVGSGAVVERRAQHLLAAGAIVEIISPVGLSSQLKTELTGSNLIWHQREYRYGDLAEAWLAVAASHDALINDTVQREAKACGILVYVVDRPGRGNVQMPVCIQRGDLRFWISTGGISPALVRRLRAELSARYGPSYAVLVRLLREARIFLQANEPNARRRQELLQELVTPEWESICRRGLRTARAELKLWLQKKQQTPTIPMLTEDPDSEYGSR